MTAGRHRAATMVRKRFGQHFLHDQGVIARIVDAIAPCSGECIVEIGPGRGALTGPLLERTGTLHVVEVDRTLAAYLEHEFRAYPALTVHTMDALRLDLGPLCPPAAQLRIVGNLPYNISTPLLFHLLAQRTLIRDMHFMLQKEVVERIVAAPGTRRYGRLSVMVQFHCRAEWLFTVGAGAFHPAPKVESAIVRLQVPDTPDVAVDAPAALQRIVAQAFSRRRKTLRNALRGLLDEAEIRNAGIDPQARPETLSVSHYAALANSLHKGQ